MAQKRSGPPPIVYILVLLLLGGGAYWWFFMRQPSSPVANNGSTPTSTIPPNTNIPVTTPKAFPPPSSVPAGTTVRIDGSTSMVLINQTLKKAFESKFPGTKIETNATGTEKGIQGVSTGTIDVAAVSRLLTPAEQTQGLVGIAIATDSIAVIVSNTNPFSGGLTAEQVAGIFEGNVKNWSEVGGPNLPIQVINRPPISGTNKTFQELAMQGKQFSPSAKTLPRDETTGLIRELKNNGIGYATFAQVKTQNTVRVVTVNGVYPGAPNYPFQRQLFYVYKEPVSAGVQAFLGFATSPNAQGLIK